MKANINTVLVGSKVILVPYRPEHVPKYHEWMLNEELRTLTASEPLSLEEEYEMQQKWQNDEDKLTFIILFRPHQSKINISESVDPTDPRLKECQMVGDVNIFLNGAIPKDEDEFHAEAEIMIAEPSFRRQGLALEALQIMLSYATSKPSAFTIQDGSTLHESLDLTDSALRIPPSSLIIRISDTNVASIKLFGRLGFEVVKRVEVFQEVELR
ncbi:GNAT domain-containing protein, partial [Panaeolus papilionaceus]